MEFLDYFSSNQHAKLYIKLLKHPMQLFVCRIVLLFLLIKTWFLTKHFKTLPYLKKIEKWSHRNNLGHFLKFSLIMDDLCTKKRILIGLKLPEITVIMVGKTPCNYILYFDLKRNWIWNVLPITLNYEISFPF